MVVKGLIGVKLAWMWIWCSSVDRAYVLLILDHNELDLDVLFSNGDEVTEGTYTTLTNTVFWGEHY